jgi:hypothetical protein
MPKATIKGGEFSLTAVPTSNLLLSVGLGITDGKYVTISPGATERSKIGRARSHLGEL